MKGEIKNKSRTGHAVLVPEIELLRRRWGLPKEAESAVRSLLDAMEEGHTRVVLPGGVADLKMLGDSCRKVSHGLKGTPVPLVAHHEGNHWHLQSWRLAKAEGEIAQEILKRLKPVVGESSVTKPAAKLLNELFAPTQDNEKQLQALYCAVRNQFVLITGGPGSGKTYTLARILALLAHLQLRKNRTPLRVALAAPTGKAADRMRESVSVSLDKLGDSFSDTVESLKEAAGRARTLHSLLGYNPSTASCRYNADNPLPVDLVIVDEASMIDVFLWCRLLKAIPREAKLILLGDPNQLESVGMGAVLGELVRATQRNKELKSCWVHLEKTQRFKNSPGIQGLADAVVRRDALKAVDLLSGRLDGGASAGLSWEADQKQFGWELIPKSVQTALEEVASATSPDRALKAMDKIRILAAHREHAWGVKGINGVIEAHLFRIDATQDVSRVHNQPIIINQNDTETGLKNGSVGVLFSDHNGQRRAWFPAASSAEPLKDFPVTKLPDHSLAWSLTIHRSQGSEFDQVLVVLPQSESPLATRELIYTAITRAKNTVHLRGSLKVIEQAIMDESHRETGLGWALDTHAGLCCEE